MKSFFCYEEVAASHGRSCLRPEGANADAGLLLN